MTEVKINDARELYRPASARASLLYFILNDLNVIHPLYVFSLKVCPRHSSLLGPCVCTLQPLVQPVLQPRLYNRLADETF